MKLISLEVPLSSHCPPSQALIFGLLIGRLLFYPSDVSPFTPIEEADQFAEQIIEPKAGRVVMFSSGSENPHRVERLLSGQRFVLAFWFTCDLNREFQIFLDGNAHTEFSRTIKSKLEQQHSEGQGQQKQQQSKRRGHRKKQSSSSTAKADL
jgi:hypothetical protein